MEKKGELLNQLAIISDLFEKANIETKSQTVILELDEKAFIETFNKIQEKYGRKMEKPNNTFTIRIGGLDIVFNTNNA
jgi:CRP-like cAMP-binding protein